MTCVVGWIAKSKNQKTVYIGGDSCASNDETNVLRKDAKLFKAGDFLIGCCGSFRLMQLLRYSQYKGGLKSLVPPSGFSLECFMVTEFIDRCRDILKNGGCLNIEDDVETGGLFLVGVHGRLFRIDTDFQVGESKEALDAIGIGECAARAVLLHFKKLKTKLPPTTILKTALEISSQVNIGIGPPFKILSISS